MLARKTVDDQAGYITEQAYLEGEKIADEKHEYVNGKVYAMAGTSKRHNRITVNIVRALPLQRQDGTPCSVYNSDVKVRAEKVNSYYYPDVIVDCMQDDTDDYYLETPCLIVEVTSKSTEWKDYAEKLIAYQKLASLQVYLIVAQDQPLVTQYYRDAEGGWRVARFDQLDQALTLPCPEMALSLVDIYGGVTFAPSAPEDS